MLAGVARTGRATTVTFTRAQDTDRPDLAAAAGLLADAVNGLCALPDTGPCAEKPELAAAAPVPAGDVPAMLSEVDLPPVAGVERPWIGTEARVAHTNLAASRCDATRFDVTGMQSQHDPLVRHPRGEALRPLRAHRDRRSAAVEAGPQLRRRRAHPAAPRATTVSSGTDVVRVADVSTKQQDLTVWHVTTEISDDETVTYLMGIVRDGGSVAQVGFVPDGKVADGARARSSRSCTAPSTGSPPSPPALSA